MSYKIRLTFAIVFLILCILGFAGLFYPAYVLNIQFAPLMQRVFVDFSFVALILLVFVLVLTLFRGRIYCSTLCPLGILQECAGFILKKNNKPQKNLFYKYFILAAVFGALSGGTAVLLMYFDPYTLFGSILSVSIVGIVAFLLILIIIFFKNRFFCANLCPVGALLGIISRFSVNKIHIKKDSCTSCGLCEKKCQSGCINSAEKTIDNETCIKCLKCLDICPKSSLKYSTVPLKFNPKRRDFIAALSAVTLFGIFAKVGAKIGSKKAGELQDVILPPGAISEARFINKCTNCNLCVVNCPQKVIKKADAKFGAVRIDYSDGFCQFDCNKCAKICPTGAIKRLNLEEKQKTRIASAVINKSKCEQCKKCIDSCPVKAIVLVGNQPKVNTEKCIGCALCKVNCENSAIEIHATLNQKMV